MADIITHHICKLCNKKYSGYQSLWIHNKKFHINNNIQNSTNINHQSTNINQNSTNIKKYECKNCLKKFNSIQARWKHNKKCIIIKNNEIEELKELKNTIFNRWKRSIYKLVWRHMVGYYILYVSLTIIYYLLSEESKKYS